MDRDTLCPFVSIQHSPITIEIAAKAGLSDEQFEKLKAWRDELQAAKRGELRLPGSASQQSFSELDGLISNRDRVNAISINGDFVGGLTLDPHDKSNLNLIWRHWERRQTGVAIAELAKTKLGIQTCTQCNEYSRPVLNEAGISCKENPQ